MLVKLWRAAAARLPSSVQFELRRARFSRQIHRGVFRSPEPEVREITQHLRPGDWAVDVGANIGHYTCQMARCVGAAGRVLAFEPVPISFALLTANVRAAGLQNVTLLNIALSSRAQVSRMTVPTYEDSRLDNYYRARLASDGEYSVLCLPLDEIPIPQTVRLVKVDTEGHDLPVLQGMEKLLCRDRPLVIVEASASGPVAAWLTERGYTIRASNRSANIVAAAA